MPDPGRFEEAVRIARKSDVAVVVVGTDPKVADEERDGATLDFPGAQMVGSSSEDIRLAGRIEAVS